MSDKEKPTLTVAVTEGGYHDVQKMFREWYEKLQAQPGMNIPKYEYKHKLDLPAYEIKFEFDPERHIKPEQPIELFTEEEWKKAWPQS